MKNKIVIGAAAVLSVGALAWAAKDPVVMTVNGVDVPKSEFEYLYHKNSQQQIDAQPIEEYVGMFELYKMKVADAKAEGIDTTAAFISEMEQYRRDLANPYLADSVYLNKFVDEAYRNAQEEVEASHIMLPKGRNASENAASIALADSLRTLLLNGADFAELAREYSVDRTASANGGYLGYITAGRLPYSFEHTAYTLKPGEISDIVESSAGYHIMKGGARRPSRGAVMAAHIMKMVRPGASAEQEAAAKAAIDSLYQLVVANPGSFERVAVENSDDPGSARMGGQLGWFVTGQMVPEFSDVAFEMPVGEISQPVRTSYGWHIIKKLDTRGPQTREEIKQPLLTRMEDPRDERYRMIRDNRIERLAKKHKGKRNDAVIGRLKAYVAENGVDSAFYAAFGGSREEIFNIDGKPETVAVMIAGDFKNAIIPDAYIGGMFLDERLDNAYDLALVKAEEDWLEANNPDYRNLLNEYREGSLLYEVSLRKVWDKASQDIPGLESYFATHRDEYKWNEPKAKGILIQTKNDSIAGLIRARYAELGKDTALQTLRQEFRNDAAADKVLASKGVNKYVDYLMFDGPEAEPNAKFPVIFMLEPRIITAPEEMSDVRGQVTSDYQNMLEQNWTTELRKKYPVVRYEKELKKVKPLKQ